MKKKMNTKKGFTLVEIIVVLVIIAIMAAFAIPAYNGFIDRAKQSEILASGRTLLIAAQTAGQELYAIEGTLSGAAPSTDETDAEDLINDYFEGTETYTISMGKDGKVTKIEISDGTYIATYEKDKWSTATGTIADSSVIIPD